MENRSGGAEAGSSELQVSRKHKQNIPDDLIPFCVERELIDEEYPIHQHDFAQLFVVRRGSAVHKINNQDYSIEAGFVYVVTDSVPHGFRRVENLEIYNILYDSERLLAQAGRLKQHPGFQALFRLHPFYQLEYHYENRLILDPEGLTFLEKTLETLLEEVEGREQGYETLIQSYFMIIVTFLSRKYIELQKLQEPQERSLIRLASSLAYLEKHYLEPLAVGELAEMAGLSQRQYDRIFKKAYRTAPKRYLVGLRLDHACRLLACRDRSITEIAYDSGFSDGNYFSRIFKREMGLTPREYRNLV